jgi:hypothetical protein
MKQYRLYRKSRRVLVRAAANMTEPETKTEWYLAERP